MTAGGNIAPVRSVLLYPHGSDPAIEAASRAAAWLQEREVTVCVPRTVQSDRSFEGCQRLDADDVGDGVDVAVSLGGDGTLLLASRWVADYGIPVVGVNLGDLGFLTAFPRTGLQRALETALAGELRWEPRLRMRVDVRRGGKTLSAQNACNDAYIKHGEIPRMLELSTSLGDRQIAHYRADGLIVSTPLGSTAYNLAAGGPILEPGTNTLIVTPICPHSLTHRPVVVGADQPVIVTYEGARGGSGASLSVDGQWMVPLEVGDEISMRAADLPLRLVPAEASVFDVLAQKLGWSGPTR